VSLSDPIDVCYWYELIVVQILDIFARIVCESFRIEGHLHLVWGCFLWLRVLTAAHTSVVLGTFYVLASLIFESIAMLRQQFLSDNFHIHRMFDYIVLEHFWTTRLVGYLSFSTTKFRKVPLFPIDGRFCFKTWGSILCSVSGCFGLLGFSILLENVFISSSCTNHEIEHFSLRWTRLWWFDRLWFYTITANFVGTRLNYVGDRSINKMW
jgi:hypothetical protein